MSHEGIQKLSWNVLRYANGTMELLFNSRTLTKKASLGITELTHFALHCFYNEQTMVYNFQWKRHIHFTSWTYEQVWKRIYPLLSSVESTIYTFGVLDWFLLSWWTTGRRELSTCIWSILFIGTRLNCPGAQLLTTLAWVSTFKSVTNPTQLWEFQVTFHKFNDSHDLAVAKLYAASFKCWPDYPQIFLVLLLLPSLWVLYL